MKILYERGMLLFVVLYLRNELLAEVGAEVGVADGVGRYFRVAGIGQRFGGVVFDGDKVKHPLEAGNAGGLIICVNSSARR